MRNYWLRIIFGAVAIFAVGMIGVTLARQGVGRVRGVVEGSGPITVPLAFVPFKLDGQKLGSVNRVVLLREAPKQIAAVELEIKLKDSLVARGLAGCQLTANFDANKNPDRVEIHSGPFSSGVFSCVHGAKSDTNFQEFGRAVFQPGDVVVPLLLPNDIVADLKKGDIGSAGEDPSAIAEAQAESVAEANAARMDSIGQEAEKRADSLVAARLHLVDSLRAEGLRRSKRERIHRMADSPPPR